MVGYGWCLLGAHAAAWLYIQRTDALSALLSGVEPLCWPFFEDCWAIRFASRWSLHAIGLIHLGLLVVAAHALFEHRLRAFTLMLSLVNVCLALIVVLDYRFRANEYYMLFWSNLVYLAWPRRRWSVPLILVSFYFWAGLLKTNREWLSGAAMYHPLWLIPDSLTVAACWYVVVLELGVVWLLLARRLWLMNVALCQLALFHMQSLSQITWFYPVMMAFLLGWFCIDRYLGPSTGRADLVLFMRGHAPASAYALFVVFGSFQVAPHLFRGDPALTGQGRILALHMFQAKQICEVRARIHGADGTSRDVDLLLPGLPHRWRCDPIVYYNRVANLCRTRGDSDIVDVDVVMRVRRSTESDFRTVVDETAFCATKHRYSVLANNPWLR